MTNQELFFQRMNGILGAVILYLILSLLFNVLGLSLDSSDTSNFIRSGMTVHVDAKTGVNYLSKGDVLIPRLNSDGSIYVGLEE